MVRGESCCRCRGPPGCQSVVYSDDEDEAVCVDDQNDEVELPVERVCQSGTATAGSGVIAVMQAELDFPQVDRRPRRTAEAEVGVTSQDC